MDNGEIPENANERKQLQSSFSSAHLCVLFNLMIVRVIWFLDCPGPQSETAGKSDSCAGCPNQEVCATAPKGPDPGSVYYLSRS